MIRTFAPPRLILTLAAILAGLAAISLLMGPTGIGLPPPGARSLVLTEIRLPRVALAILVGAALGMSGAALQGYLRNPLAEPGLFGVTSGASLGAIVAIHTGLAGIATLAIPIAGLVGAAVATIVVLGLAGATAGAVTLILAGIAVSSLTSALSTLALNLAPNPFASSEIVIWMLGSLTDRSLLHVAVAAPVIAAGLAMLWRTGSALETLTLGEDVARNLGTDLKQTRTLIVAGTACAVGAATSVAGSIAFVGLIVPHLLRRYVNFNPAALLPASALGGAVLVLAADIGVRLLAPLGDIRLGVLTALVGAPFFLHMVLRAGKDEPP